MRGAKGSLGQRPNVPEAEVLMVKGLRFKVLLVAKLCKSDKVERMVKD